MDRKGMRNMNNNEKQEMMVPPDMNCESSETCEAPEMPEGMNGERPEMPTDGEMPSDMQEMRGGFKGGEFAMQDAGANSDAILHPAAYLAIGGGSVVLGILISYVCFSRFFHLKPGQAFATKDKFIWFIIVALVLAVGICTLGYFIPVWVQG